MSPRNISPRIDVCTSGDSLTKRAVTHSPTVLNDRSRDSAIVHCVLMSELKYVVVRRREHSVVKRCAEQMLPHFPNVSLS